MSHPPDQLSILLGWHRGLCIFHKAHFRAAALFKQRHLQLGLPTVLLTTIAGTAVFSTLQVAPSLAAKVAVGLCSLTAAVLASLQTFLRYSDLAHEHRTAAVKYGNLRRELEEALAVHRPDNPCPQSFMTQLRQRWGAIDEESPPLPQRVFDPVAAEFPAAPTGIDDSATETRH